MLTCDLDSVRIDHLRPECPTLFFFSWYSVLSLMGCLNRLARMLDVEARESAVVSVWSFWGDWYAVSMS